MKTYANPTAAYNDNIGRNRKRNEVEHGITYSDYNGHKIVQSVRLLHANREDGLQQAISPDYKTLIVYNDKDTTYINNFLLGLPIQYYIGGDFAATELKQKRIKGRTPYSYTYSLIPTKVTHKVLFAEYQIIDIDETEDGLNLTLQMVE